VRKGLLHAPGTLTLSDLELLPAVPSGKITGMSASAAIALMKNRKGKISVRFVLDGDINDPHFSLNETMLKTISTSLADMLGVSVGGLAKGVQGIGSGATKGLGDTLNKLIKK
jgi:glycerol-3-phosphate dehydrogenase